MTKDLNGKSVAIIVTDYLEESELKFVTNFTARRQKWFYYERATFLR